MAIMRGPGNIVRGSFPGTWRLAKRLLGRYRTPGPQLWKQYNVNQIQRLESALNQNGWSLGDFSSILDFGCGPGRMTQHLCWLASNAQIFGCDIDPEAVRSALEAPSAPPPPTRPWGSIHLSRDLPCTTLRVWLRRSSLTLPSPLGTHIQAGGGASSSSGASAAGQVRLPAS